MRTEYNVYKIPARSGVPIGPEIFQSFIGTLQKNVEGLINLTFSSPNGEITQGQGGYVETNPVDKKSFFGFNFPSATGDSQGLVYGRAEDGRFTLFKVPKIDTPEQVSVTEWDLLASDYDRAASTNTLLSFKNDLINNDLRLPFRPVRQNFNLQGQVTSFSYGFSGVRYNGIPQDFFQAKLSETNFLSGVEFSFFRFGAELPNPLYNSRYISELETGINLEEFNLLGNANSEVDLEFRFTNFSDYGSHVLLRRVDLNGDAFYYYLKEDRSSEDIVPAGTYRVQDRGRGIIRTRLNDTILFEIAATEEEKNSLVELRKIRFTVICPEELLEERQDQYIAYKSRYGKVYNPLQSGIPELLKIFYSGEDPVLSRVVLDDFSLTEDQEKTDVLFYGDLEESGGTAILALNYRGFPVVDQDKQRSTYFPDTINFYYAYGISDATLTQLGLTSSDVRGFIDINKAFYYNWDVGLDEYNPVHRAENYSLSLIGKTEVPGNGIVFNPFVPILRWRWGKPEPIYVYYTKTTLGTKDEFMRRDAHFPEPHHVNPAQIRNTLVSDEPFTVPLNETMAYPFEFKCEGTIIVEGTLVVY